MTTKVASGVGRPGPIRFLLLGTGTMLALYGGLGLLFDLHLPERVLQAVFLWRSYLQGGQWPGPEAPQSWATPPWLAGVSLHFDRAVLWLWLAWGVGLLLLAVASGRRAGFGGLPRRALCWRDAAALLVLVVVVFLGYGLRARFLLPLSEGIVPVSHYDEMVYLEDALLWRNGLSPYRDYFLAHPPGILLALLPAALAGQAWGGLEVLAAGRAWQCFYGLATVVLLYLVGREVAGRRGGLLAALVLAADVQAAQVAPLETVVNLASVAALGLYLAALKARASPLRFLLAALSGGLATYAALTKAPGAVTLLLLAAMAMLGAQWRSLLAGGIGAAATALLLAGPFVARAPGAFWRQVVAFQMLRPQETAYGRNHLARMADYPDSRLTFLLLAAGVLLLTIVVLAEAWGGEGARRDRRAEPGPAGWVLPLALMVVLLLALFSYGRAYHSRYYIQLIVPFALLAAAGFDACLAAVRAWPLWGRGSAALAAAAVIVASWPHLVQQNLVGQMVRYDGTYGPIGRALQEAVSPGTAVLALDPGYPLLAARPPAKLPDGTRLVDGAGLMAYHALELPAKSVRQVLVEARESSREIDPKQVFHRPAAQDLIASAMRDAGASVIDPRIAAEDLTPQTQEFLATRGQEIARIQYTAAFLVERVGMVADSGVGLSLWDLNMRALLPQSGEGPAARPGAELELSRGEALQVTLYWYVERRPVGPLLVQVEVRDATGASVLKQCGAPHFGEPPADQWRPGWVYQDHHNLAIPSEVGPGLYSLHLSLCDAVSFEPWEWHTGGLASEEIVVGVVRLLP